MNLTRVFFASVLGVVLALGQVRAQAPEESIGTAPTPIVGSDIPVQDNQPFPRILSNWITYQRNNCCEAPLGHNLPIGTEFFVRSGPSVPIEGDVYGRVLDVGWVFQGGVRALFWDNSLDRAWTVEASISNQSNRAGTNDVRIPLSVIDNFTGKRQEFGKGNLPGVTVAGLNRTFVNLGFGREYYLWQPANAPGTNLRAGWDGGGRYGTCKGDFHEIRHRTDVIGGAWASIHTDLEIPCGCCIFQCGLRSEWAYTWSDILQRQSDVMDLNFLVNLGVRY